uniref:Uncharacterized protein n=1 Tax=Ditylenchus dipsaci TaxID=166011 RepID=A0A915DPH0_9BILA
MHLIEFPVFYKGHLIMEVNQDLVLLEPSMRSLETDIQSLGHNVSRHKRVDLERHFWLKIKSNMRKKRKRVYWCPAKEVYREYLRKLIDSRLCSSSPLLIRVVIVKKTVQDSNILQLHPIAYPRKLQLGSDRGCYLPSSVFTANCSPLELIAKKTGQSRLPDTQQSTSLLEIDQKWLEITCDTPTKQHSHENLDDRRVNGDNGQSGHINKTKPPSNRRFSIRIFQGRTGHYWARPTFSEVKLREMQADLQLPQPCFLGDQEDCQDYLNKLFCSITERGTVVVEVIKPLQTPLECVLPEKIQGLLDTRPQSNGCSASINCRIDDRKTVYTILFKRKT